METNKNKSIFWWSLVMIFLFFIFGSFLIVNKNKINSLEHRLEYQLDSLKHQVEHQLDSINFVIKKLNCKNPDTVVYSKHYKIVICDNNFAYEVTVGDNIKQNNSNVDRRIKVY